MPADGQRSRHRRLFDCGLLSPHCNTAAGTQGQWVQLLGSRRAHLSWLASDLTDADEIVAVCPIVALIGAHRRYAFAIGAVGRSALVAGGDLEEELGANVVTGDSFQALAVAPGRTAGVSPVDAPVPAAAGLLGRVAPESSGVASIAAGALVGDSQAVLGLAINWRTWRIARPVIAGDRARLRQGEAGERREFREDLIAL
jgi:hypothetical protein